MLLIRWQKAGYESIVVIGNATALIGDPSGKSKERPQMNMNEIEENKNKIEEQIINLFEGYDLSPPKILHNSQWWDTEKWIDILRQVGTHLTMNTMLSKESVSSRLETGLSFTEFSYQLMQAHDFYHLASDHGVNMQFGGADQWGNITAGIEYIRRRSYSEGKGRVVHGLTTPLLTNSNGDKLGKTEEGKTLWLDPEKTSPYEFYQFWINVPDSEVDVLESVFLPEERDTSLFIQLRKERLAKILTTLIHGEEELNVVSEATGILFGGNSRTSISLEALNILEKEITRHIIFTQPTLIEFLHPTVLTSKGAIRRLVQGGGLMINFKRVETEDLEKPLPSPLHKRYYLIRKGKKDYSIILSLRDEDENKLETITQI